MAQIIRAAQGLAFVELKTRRAKKQLDDLETTLGEFVKDAYTVTRQDYRQKRRHVLRFEFKPMPYEIGMLAGEFAYSLRSGLDQLAWQLALLNTRPRRPRSHTSFPVWSKPPDKGFGDATKDVLPAAIPVIESVQPYQRGTGFNRHPMYLLNELCIIDKHMVLPVRASAGTIHVRGADILRRRELEYGFELFFELTDKFRVQLDPIKTDIIFGEPIGGLSSGFEIQIEDFRAIHDFVQNDVIPRFAGFFK